MDDYYDAYMAQFTMGCDCPFCSSNECCSSKNFKYIDYTFADLQVIADLYRNTKEHICPCLSPLVINPMLFQDIDNFSEWVKEFIDHRNHPNEELSFEAFEQAIDNPDIFCFTFMKGEECSSDNFSIDEDALIQFFDECKLQKHLFSRFETKIFNLCNSYNICQEPGKLHALRGKFLSISLYPLIPILFTFKLFFEMMDYVPSDQKFFFKGQICFYNKFFLKIILYYQDNLSEFSISMNRNVEPNIWARCASLLDLIYTATRNNSPFPHNIWPNSNFCQKIDPQDILIQIIQGSIIITPLFTLNFKYRLKLLESIFLKRSNISRLPLLTIRVRRDQILEDTINALRYRRCGELQAPLNIVFDGEKGEDQGGVSREFFHLMTIKLFSEDFGMFQKINDGRLFWFCTKSFETQSFHVVGVLVGLAIHNSLMLPIRLPYVLYKKLLEIPLTLKDLTEIKPEVVQSLEALLAMKKSIEQNKPQTQNALNANVIGNDNANDSANANNEENDLIAKLDLRFEITVDNFGVPENNPLIENGSNILVTKNNIEYYIDRIIQWELSESVARQFNAFSTGFWDAVGSHLVLRTFFEEEIDILVSGQEVYDWSEFREFSIYESGYEKDSESIVMFWDVFENELNEEQKINFLMFVTGSKRVPIGGLKSLRLIIQKSTNLDMLPVAHTCAAILQLPDYCNREKMKKGLLVCVEYCEGFGIV